MLGPDEMILSREQRRRISKSTSLSDYYGWLNPHRKFQDKHK